MVDKTALCLTLYFIGFSAANIRLLFLSLVFIVCRARCKPDECDTENKFCVVGYYSCSHCVLTSQEVIEVIIEGVIDCLTITFCCGCFIYCKCCHQKAIEYRYKILYNKQFFSETNLVHLDQKDDLYLLAKRLVKETWKDGTTAYGRDARGLTHSNVTIRAIYSINNSKLQGDFSKVYNSVKYSDELPEVLKRSPIRTSSILQKSTNNVVAINIEETITRSQIQSIQNNSENGHGRVDSITLGLLREGEVYLFHGAPLKNTRGIINCGFDVSQSRRGLYGSPGIYLAESSQKADQYADKTSRFRRRTRLTMLIVRVCLGHVNVNTANSTGGATTDVTPDKCKCDTLVAGLKARFREFIKYDSNQCYPEFLVVYDRV